MGRLSHLRKPAGRLGVAAFLLVSCEAAEVAVNLEDVSIPGWERPVSATYVNRSTFSAQWQAARAPERAKLPTTDLYLAEAFLSEDCSGAPIVSSNTMDTSIVVKDLQNAQVVSFGIRVRNQEGHLGPLVCSEPVRIKMTRPAASSTTAPPTTSSTGQLVFSGSCEDEVFAPHDLKIAICANANGTCETMSDYTHLGVCNDQKQYEEKITLSDGTYDVDVVVVDPVGNVSVSSDSYKNVVIDTTGPMTPTVSVAATEVVPHTASIAFSWTTSDQGPAGLRATDTYKVKVFQAANCQGSVLNEYTMTSPSYNLAGPFTNGHVYSLGVLAYDAFDHVSALGCSPAVTVKDVAANISYPAQTWIPTTGRAFSLSPTVDATSGTITGCTIAPTPPTGISINSSCVISGTTSTASAMTTYTVTATTSAGNATFSLDLGSRSFCGGDGTVASPYLLCSAEDLYDIDSASELASHYKLANDIDFSAFHAGRRYIIGDDTHVFSATFDGNGKVLKNLNLNFPTSTSSNFGLFRKIAGAASNNKAQIKDLTLENVVVTGDGDYVGALAGQAVYTDFINVYLTQTTDDASSITGRDHVGGLIGESTYCNVRGVSVAGVVNGRTNAGGIVGSEAGDLGIGTIISGSKASISVTATGDVAGGVIGLADDLIIENTLGFGKVTGANKVGGLVGYADTTTIRGSASSADASGSGTSIGGLVGASTALTVNDASASGKVTGHTNTGGLVGALAASTSSIRSSWATGDVSGQDATGGLIGFVGGGTVTLSHASGTVQGEDLVGGLIGSINTVVTLSQSHASGAVTATGSSVGGLVGQINGSTNPLSQVSATGAVQGLHDVGGLIGCTSVGIQDSYATGSVTSMSSDPDESRVGGLIGCTSANLSVTRAYASGVVTSGAGTNFGGLIGGAANGTPTITASYHRSPAGNAYGTFLTATELQDATKFVGWDFATPVWLMRDNQSPFIPYPEVVNDYFYITDTLVSAGSDTLHLGSTEGLSPGDEVLVVQMQHPTETSAGIYELASVATVIDDVTIKLMTGLTYDYESARFATPNAKAAQVVKVKNFTTHTIKFGETLTAPTWNGMYGGMVAIRASGLLTIEGTIDVAGRGFAGGTSAPLYPCAVMPVANGYAGESWNGRGLIGADANGGGGGAGNSGQCGYNGWTGAAGGGGGAYGTAAEDRSDKNLEQKVIQGTGGSTYGVSTLERLLLGSGGGAGGAHDVGASANGGAGGGIVYIAADQVKVDGTTGVIDASGGDGLAAVAPSGAGGGGSGGSVLITTVQGADIGSGRVRVGGGNGGSGAKDASNISREKSEYRDGAQGGDGRIHTN